MSDNTADFQRKAVALKDGAEGNPARITASGRGIRAEEILDVAFATGVAVRQDPALTDILEQFDELCPIPIEALHAVAEVMSHVYTESQRYRVRNKDSDESKP